MSNNAMTNRWPPVLGIWGRSGSGKTYLINQLLRGALERKGLRVAVVKRCSHSMSVDTPGKDSDVIFSAGADVYAHSPGQAFFRIRSDDLAFQSCLDRIGRGYDLILVEGHRNSPVPKIWLSSKAGTDAATDVKNVVATLPWDSNRASTAEILIDDFLIKAHAAVATYSAVLVGGQSRRMGRAKSMLKTKAGFLLERIVDAARVVSTDIVLVGAAPIPVCLANMKRLPDVPEVPGPLGGLLSAFRWQPRARWILLACDMPFVTEDALRWLLGKGRPGTWVVAPRLKEHDECEPMVALYEPPAGVLLEKAAARGVFSFRRILEGNKIASPGIPDKLRKTWANVNIPADWDAALGCNTA